MSKAVTTVGMASQLIQTTIVVMDSTMILTIGEAGAEAVKRAHIGAHTAANPAREAKVDVTQGITGKTSMAMSQVMDMSSDMISMLEVVMDTAIMVDKVATDTEATIEDMAVAVTMAVMVALTVPTVALIALMVATAGMAVKATVATIATMVTVVRAMTTIEDQATGTEVLINQAMEALAETTSFSATTNTAETTTEAMVAITVLAEVSKTSRPRGQLHPSLLHLSSVSRRHQAELSAQLALWTKNTLISILRATSHPSARSISLINVTFKESQKTSMA